MTQCVLRGEAQHPSLRRSLLHPSGPPFRRPGRAQRGPGPIGLSAISLPSREAIRPRRSRPGRRSVCCDAALKIKPLAGLVFVMPAHRRGHPFRWRSRKWLAGPGPRGVAVFSHLAAMRGGAGSREAGPCVICVSLSAAHARRYYGSGPLSYRTWRARVSSGQAVAESRSISAPPAAMTASPPAKGHGALPATAPWTS